MFKVFVLLCLGISFIGCSPKPSDSDVGRVEEEDGFKVKAFMTASSSNIDENAKDVLRNVMENDGIKERESTTTNSNKTTTYLSSAADKMIKIYKVNGKVTKVLVEGDEDFITSIIEEVDKPEKFTVRLLLNAKKTYVNNMQKVKQTVNSFIKKHKLSKEWNLSFNSDKKIILTNQEKRVVKKGNGDYFTVTVEGKREFVDELRELLADIQ